MKNKTLTKIQIDTATEANWPKILEDYIRRCNMARLAGYLESKDLRPMSNVVIPVKHIDYECYEINGDYVKRTGKFYYTMFDYRSCFLTKMSVVNVSKSKKTTAFDKPPSLN